MEPRLVVCAGMHRSGSTWLYNAVRLILASQMLPVYATFVSNYRKSGCSDGRPIHVVKTHRYYRDIQEAAECVFTTRRDLRDLAASAVRMGLCPSTRSGVIEYLTRVLDEDYIPWVQFSDFEMPYETMMADQERMIGILAAFMGFSVNEVAVREQIDRLTHEDPETLLAPGHITKGTPGSFPETLPEDCILAVETAFQRWQEQHGYSQRPDHSQRPSG